MNVNENSIFEPRNPIFLNFVKWVIIITSLVMMFIGVIALAQLPGQGLVIIIGSIIYYFMGMVYVNMLFNIKDIKDQTKLTNELLTKQIELLKKNEIE